MADIKPTGLFGGPTQDDVVDLMNREKQARIQQAMQAHAGGGYLASLAAKAQQQGIEALKQGLGGAAGAMGMPVREDPRLAKARKREKDRGEINQILAGYASEGSEGGSQITEKEIRKGFSELMSRGYQEDAQKFLTMAQSFAGERRQEVETGVKVSSQKLAERKVELDSIHDNNLLTLDQKRLNIDTWEKKNNVKIKWEEVGIAKDQLKDRKELALMQLDWKQKIGTRKQDEIEAARKIQDKWSEMGLAISQEGELRKQKQLELSDRIQTGTLELSADDHELRSKIADYEQRFKDKSFDHQKYKDELNHDLALKGYKLDVTKHKEGTRIRLLELSSAEKRAAQGFDLEQQRINLQEKTHKADIKIRESIANNNIYVSGKRLDMDTLNSEHARQIATKDLALRETVGLTGIDERKHDRLQRRWAKENDIRLAGNAQKFDKESFYKNQEILRDRLDWQKEFGTAQMKQTDRHKTVDDFLNNRRAQLEEDKFDFNKATTQEKAALASEMFAEEKRLNIHKMNQDEQRHALQEKLFEFDMVHKREAINYKKMSLAQLKELAILQQDESARQANQRDATTKRGQDFNRAIARIQAKASGTQAYQAPTDNHKKAFVSVYETNKPIEDAFDEIFNRSIRDLSNDEVTAMVEEVNQIRTERKGMGMKQGMEIFLQRRANKKGGGGANKKFKMVKKDKVPPSPPPAEGPPS